MSAWPASFTLATIITSASCYPPGSDSVAPCFVHLASLFSNNIHKEAMPAVPFTHAGYKPQPLPAGIYAPIPTPFKTDGSEDLDTDALVRHAKRLAAAGIGLVVSGSTGEAVAMTHAERAQAVYAIRAASPTVPIIAGTGGGSLRETIVFCHEAAAAGADAAIVIAPGYFSASIAQDRKALKEFFCETADKSPVPVMVYNFPAAAGGIDLDSELLEEIAEHPNICGAKVRFSESGLWAGGNADACSIDLLLLSSAYVCRCWQGRASGEQQARQGTEPRLPRFPWLCRHHPS